MEIIIWKLCIWFRMAEFLLTPASEWMASLINTPNEDEIIVNSRNVKRLTCISKSLHGSSLCCTFEKIIKSMAPVTSFCSTLAITESKRPINNFSRTKSLDNLNFEEKRRVIASTLSLADLLQQGSSASLMLLIPSLKIKSER